MKIKHPSITVLTRLVKEIKKDIADDYRAFEGDEIPGIQLTVGVNTETGKWSYQTGDNSYTGGAYHYPVWGVVGVYRRSNSREVARDIVSQIHENAPIA